jgi:CubicO group peptidase (beta-lactamase class C family)
VPTAYSRQSGGVLERQPSRTGGELRFILPGGSLFTTLDELAAFGVMHLENGMCHDKQVLSRESIDEMRTLQLPQKVTRRYGLGWFCDDIDDQGLADRVYHGGAMGAYLVVDRKRVKRLQVYETNFPSKLVNSLHHLSDVWFNELGPRVFIITTGR